MSDKVFIPDESGMGGEEVELGKATFDMDVHKWLVYQSPFRARAATEDEIREARGLTPEQWEGHEA